MKAWWKRGAAAALLAIVLGWVAVAAATEDGEPGKLPVVMPTTIPPAAEPPANVVVPVQMIETPKPDAAVMLEWAGPPVIRLNQPNDYTLTVKNVSAGAVQKVTVQVRAPKDATISGTKPAAKVIDGVQLWELGTLDFKQTKDLKITLVPTARGELDCQAWVTFTGTTGMKVRVEEPKISVTITTPSSVPEGEPIEARVVVKNIGDCVLENIHADLSPDGGDPAKTNNAFQAYNLKPNQEATFSRTAIAKANGLGHNFRVEAFGSGVERVHAECKTVVLAPKLTTTISGPKELLVGRTGTFTATVENTGAVPLMVAHDCPLPIGWTRVDAPKITPPPFLAPGAKYTQTFQAMPSVAGPSVFLSRADSDRRAKASAEHTTLVVGIPALRMELIDTVDPVEKGKETVYEIRVVNTGTKSDTNVVITCPIPQELKFLRASGPVGHKVVDLNGVSMLTFEPIRELAPKTEAVFRVIVKAIGTGDIRFKAVLNSPTLSTSVVKEESTRVYGE